MRLIAALTIPVSLLLAQNPSPAPLGVVAVRHFILHDATRVAIEVTGKFEFRTDRLHNPERVYYDILNAVPRIVKGPRMYSEAVDDKLLQRVRVAETARSVTRIVLDLGDGVEATCSTLTNPDRLVVELRGAGSKPSSTPTTSSAPPPAPTTAAVREPEPPVVHTNPTRQFVPPALPAAKPVTPTVSSPPAMVHQQNSGMKQAAALISAPTKPAPPPAPVNNAGPAPLETVAESAGSSSMTTASVNAAAIPSAPSPSAGGTPVGTKAPANRPSLSLSDEVAAGARHTSSGDNSLIRALGLKINRVVIDPGHGGHDNGTEGAKGLLEKDLVLDVAMRLGKLIENRMAAEVIYTRTDDTFVPLEGRTALANEKKADLFLSIHANSSNIPRISGVETFYLNITGTRDAIDLAARENATAQTSIFELQDIIKKITLHDKSEESLEFAKRIQAALFAFSSKSLPSAKDRGVKSAPFVVLIGANMPSVLAEIGFLSNPREEALLKRSDYRDKLAEALYKGIERYASGLSHFAVAAKP